MIVDDRKCIFGSKRVSEDSVMNGVNNSVAVVLEDKQTVQSKMSGKDFAAGAFASGLRQKLMREHMGCDLELVSYVEDTFAQYHEYARENHSRLHTLCGKSRTSKSRERQIISSVIEVALRIIFDVDSTAAWKHIHKGQSPLGLEPLVFCTRSSQFHIQLRLSQVFNTEKFIAHIDNFRSDAFKIINLLKGLFYLQHTVLEEKVVTLFSGLEYLSSKCFVSSMFKLANMIDPFNFSDVLDSSFCEMWDTTATRNTAIFRTVFYCQPDDHVKDGEHLFKKYEKQFLCCQLQLAKDPLLEASFEPADDILKNDATDEYTNKFVTELSSSRTGNKVAKRKQLAKQLLETVNGRLVRLPCHYLEEAIRIEKEMSKGLTPGDVFCDSVMSTI